MTAIQSSAKKDFDNLEGVWERFIEAFQGLEEILCSVKLKKCNQFCLSRKVKGWLPMITSEEEVFDNRRLFYLPKKPHDTTITTFPAKKTPNQNPHSMKSNSCKLKLAHSKCRCRNQHAHYLQWRKLFGGSCVTGTVSGCKSLSWDIEAFHCLECTSKQCATTQSKEMSLVKFLVRFCGLGCTKQQDEYSQLFILALKLMNFKTCFRSIGKQHCAFISVASSSKEAWEKLFTKAKRKVKNGGNGKEGK